MYTSCHCGFSSISLFLDEWSKEEVGEYVCKVDGMSDVAEILLGEFIRSDGLWPNLNILYYIVRQSYRWCSVTSAGEEGHRRRFGYQVSWQEKEALGCK